MLMRQLTPGPTLDIMADNMMGNMDINLGNMPSMGHKFQTHVMAWRHIHLA